MIVFDLNCARGHVFEAWFGSSTDYEDQKARGLLSCPTCGEGVIDKAVMAPAVAAKGNQRADRAPRKADTPDRHAVAAVNPGDSARMQALVEGLARMQAKLLENSHWVGRDFADRARAMHYGEQDRSSIHGEVAPEEAKALFAEGVEVAPLPFPVVPPQAKN